MNKILMIIDPQVDFIDGSLAVKGSKEIMDGLSRYITLYGKDYSSIIISCDKHPINHCSFNTEGGQWPIHCVEHSVGAAIYPPIMDAVVNTKLNNKGILINFLEKGQDWAKEEYSAVDSKFNQETVNRLVDLLKVEQIDVCGICGDICILNTLSGLQNMKLNDKLFVMQEFCPSIDDGSTLKNFIKENNLKHS